MFEITTSIAIFLLVIAVCQQHLKISSLQEELDHTKSVADDAIQAIKEYEQEEADGEFWAERYREDQEEKSARYKSLLQKYDGDEDALEYAIHAHGLAEIHDL